MKSRWTVLLPAALLFLACSLSAATQSGQDLTDLSKDIETLKAGQESIAHQLEELKVLLQARPAAAPVAAPLPAEIVLDIQGAPTTF